MTWHKKAVGSAPSVTKSTVAVAKPSLTPKPAMAANKGTALAATKGVGRGHGAHHHGVRGQHKAVVTKPHVGRGHGAHHRGARVKKV